MAKNQCINCGFFLNCEKACSEKENCEKFIKAKREITKIENQYRKEKKKCQNL